MKPLAYCAACWGRMPPWSSSLWWCSEECQKDWLSPESLRIREKRDEREALRVRMCTWVAANGLDPMRVICDSTIITRADTVTVEMFVCDPAGRPMLNARGTDAARRWHTVPLLVGWPQDLVYAHHYHAVPHVGDRSNYHRRRRTRARRGHL